MYIIEVASFKILAKDRETILEALMRTGNSIDYQCKEGFCGSCRMRLCLGTVEYVRQPLASLKLDGILVCCAIGTTNTIVI